MYLSHINPRDFSPGLVRIGVVIEELVAQHERNREQSVLTSGLSSHIRIELLQSVNEQESEYDHVLGHLGRRKNRGHPLAEAGRRDSVRGKVLVWKCAYARIFDLLEDV